MTDFATLIEPARHVVERASALGLVLATAESCTGGLIAALLTEIPGSSAVVDRGFVTYSNQAKAELLGVPLSLIDAHGAVSREVALAMVEGALAGSSADMAVSVTGIAGPGGGSRDKPVGLVHFGFAVVAARCIITRNASTQPLAAAASVLRRSRSLSPVYQI